MALFGQRKVPPPGGSATAGPAPFLQAFRTEDGGMTVALDPSKIESPGHAGIMIVDIMRHMARAMKQYGTVSSEDEANARMLELVLAEYENPTDPGTGSIVN